MSHIERRQRAVVCRHILNLVELIRSRSPLPAEVKEAARVGKQLTSRLTRLRRRR